MARVPSAMPLLLVAALCALLSLSGVSAQTTAQWGYTLQCPPFTLDYPCQVRVSGTATLSSVTPSTAVVSATAVVNNGSSYSYYTMTNFVGQRVFTNRFGVSSSAAVTGLATIGVNGANNRLALSTNGQVAATPVFVLNSRVQVYGGLFADNIRLVVAAGGYPVESVAINGFTGTNSLNADPATVTVCSTAPGLVPSAYDATTGNARFSASMADCTNTATLPAATSYTAAQLAVGLKNFAFTYSITDQVSFAAQVSATIQTDGTVNFDQLGNLYYNIIGIQGTRSEQSLINVSAVSTVSITSLMAPNIIFTSNVPYISNNNRIYLTYPFLDRYGFAYTVSSSLTSVTQPELEDGYIDRYTNTIGVYIYRSDTLDEQGLDGGFSYPAFNVLDQQYNNLALTALPVPSVYQLVQFCYVFYGLPQTLDYPWGVVLSGTALINNTLYNRNTTSNSYGVPEPQPVYNLLGFVGLRNFTNRFGQTFVSAVTADALGEDANVGVLSPITPYTAPNSVSFHLNGTIQTPGGLPATDISFFLDPYPIEGTAYGYGIGTGTNALNNDPARTVIASNMPGFVPSTFSDSDYNNLAGTVYGTTDLSQCRVSFTPVATGPSAADLAPGVRVYNFAYTVVAANGSVANANYQLVTDGSVNIDGLGNVYYNILQVTGVRTYMTASLTQVNRVTNLLPLCSGPSVSNLNNIYCSDNHLYPQYPYVDRLGFAFQLDQSVPRFGSSIANYSRELVIYVYRHVVLEEASASSNPNFNDSAAARPIVTLTQVANGAAQFQTFQWGYLLFCAPAALEYPCAVSVTGTVLAGLTTVTSVCDPTQQYGPLCNQLAYQIIGFNGTRTFSGKYGQRQISYLGYEPPGEDYADDLLYLNQPYVDTDGPTFHLNGSASAQGGAQILTQVIGGLQANEINLFLYPQLVEGIAVNGAGSSAIIYNPTSAVVCSTMPGFVPASYNVSTLAPAGRATMSSCNPPTYSNAVPAFTATVNPLQYTFTYSVSDGATFAAQVVAQITSDDAARVDTLGNRYFLIASATGTRTYFNFSTGATVVSQITGVAPAGNFSFGTAVTGNTNSNRLYPFSAPYVDALGVAFTFAAPAPLAGIQTNTASTILLQYYKDQTLEELPVATRQGGRYPVASLQASSLTPGFVAITLPAPQPLQTASLCLIFYSLAGDPEYPWSSAVKLSITYNPVPVTTAYGTAVLVTAATGTRTFTNKFGQASPVNVTLDPPFQYYNDNLLYLNSPLPLDPSGITLYLGTVNTVELPGHGPTVQYAQLNYYRDTVTLTDASNNVQTQVYIQEDASSRVDQAGSAFLSSVPGFLNVTIGGANANIGAVNYAQCTAPITFANGARTPVIANTFNGGARVQYNYIVSDGLTYTISTQLTLTMDSAIASHTDPLGNQYQLVTGVTGTRVYTYLPTNAVITSVVSGVSNGAYQYADQRFYPFALLGSSAGIYSTNTAPFVDYDGIEFNITPGAPAAGLAPGVGTLYNATSVYTEARELSPVLVDGYFSPSLGYGNSGPSGIPVLAFQQQTYQILG